MTFDRHQHYLIVINLCVKQVNAGEFICDFFGQCQLIFRCFFGKHTFLPPLSKEYLYYLFRCKRRKGDWGQALNCELFRGENPGIPYGNKNGVRDHCFYQFILWVPLLMQGISYEFIFIVTPAKAGVQNYLK